MHQLSSANIECCTNNASECYSFPTLAACESSLNNMICLNCFTEGETDLQCSSVSDTTPNEEYIMTDTKKDSMLEIVLSKYDPRISSLRDCGNIYSNSTDYKYACEIGFNISQKKRKSNM